MSLLVARRPVRDIPLAISLLPCSRIGSPQYNLHQPRKGSSPWSSNPSPAAWASPWHSSRVFPPSRTPATSRAARGRRPRRRSPRRRKARESPAARRPSRSRPRRTILDQFSIACVDMNTDAHADNSYWRAFDLRELGVTGPLDVCEVAVGIELADDAAGAGQPLTVNLWDQFDHAFPATDQPRAARHRAGHGDRPEPVHPRRSDHRDGAGLRAARHRGRDPRSDHGGRRLLLRSQRPGRRPDRRTSPPRPAASRRPRRSPSHSTSRRCTSC